MEVEPFGRVESDLGVLCLNSSAQILAVKVRNGHRMRSASRRVGVHGPSSVNGDASSETFCAYSRCGECGNTAVFQTLSPSALERSVRQHEANEQDERVEIDQPEMAKRGDPVWEVQGQRDPDANDWGEQGSPERPALAITDAIPRQCDDSDTEGDDERGDSNLQMADVLI